MKRLSFFSILFLFQFFHSKAQIGGQHVYDFLRLTPSARIASLGNVNISTYDRDVNLAWANPALANDSMHKNLSFTAVNYLADIFFGYVGYAHHLNKVGNFHAGLQYVNYGKQTQTDDLGTTIGNIQSNELALGFGLSRDFDKFHFGTNAKFLYSNLAGYSSVGMLLDFGGAWHHPEKNVTIAATLKNVGLQFNSYTKNGSRESIPFEIQAGVSHKLKYLPLRISATLIHLESPKMIYKDPNKKQEFDLAGNPIKEKNTTVDNLFRHLVIGAEFIFTKNFHVRLGYNHQRRQELKATGTNFRLTGFSFGVGLRIYKFYLDYGFGNYFVQNHVHQFTIATDLSKFTK